MKKKNIEVLPPGTSVKIGGDIDAIVTAISIRGPEYSLSYECQWIDDSVKSQWIDEIMVQPKEKVEKLKIGF